VFARKLRSNRARTVRFFINFSLMKYASAKLAWKWRSFRCSRSSCPAQDGPALSYYLWPSYFLLFLLFFLLNLPSCCPPAVLFKLSVCTQNAVVPASVHFADLACKLQPTFVPAISMRRSLGFLSSLWNIYSWQIFFNNFLINLPSWRVGFFFGVLAYLFILQRFYISFSYETDICTWRF